MAVLHIACGRGADGAPFMGRDFFAADLLGSQRFVFRRFGVFYPFFRHFSSYKALSYIHLEFAKSILIRLRLIAFPKQAGNN
jgi:hypothetical protein